MRIRKRSLLPYIPFSPSLPLSDLLPNNNPSHKYQNGTSQEEKPALGSPQPVLEAGERNEKLGLHPDEDFKKLQGSCDFKHQPKEIVGRSSSDLQRRNQEDKPINPDHMKVFQGEEDAGYNSNLGSGAETATGLSLPSYSSHQLVGRWCEGERAFPLKKRRGSFGEKAIMKTKVEIKTNKKLNDNEDDGDEEEEMDSGVKKLGKSTNGGAIIQGSRCSRVNGRGWRCCQQTLVGYSLCEHHLGKGRLRSMSSVRNRSFAVTRPNKDEENGHDNVGLLSTLAQKDKEDMNIEEAEEDDEILRVTMKKKRKKIGMVKARSISSLLGQTEHIITITTPTDITTSTSNVIV
ncbi:uncharacterized protein LOC143876798 [Tasmannia lanceolata]|uniref:uncharacterized protein LOC143876798 n=1 Tax=Tasmannia lanceolata TaxID=3420 RepID=UPI004063C259